MPGQTDENRLHVLRHAAFTARDVREMERPLLENGVPLMRMASAATAHVVAEMIEDEGVALEESNIVLLACRVREHLHREGRRHALPYREEPRRERE